MSCLRINFSSITLSLLVIVVLGSCASAPEVNNLNYTDESTQKEPIPLSSTDNSLILETLGSLESIRNEAISIKAPKAAPTAFNSGESYRKEGLDFYNNNRIDESLESYLSAINMFKESIKITKNKRERALKALNSAEQAILQTEENANRAIKEGEEEEL